MLCDLRFTIVENKFHYKYNGRRLFISKNFIMSKNLKFVECVGYVDIISLSAEYIPNFYKVSET